MPKTFTKTIYALFLLMLVGLSSCQLMGEKKMSTKELKPNYDVLIVGGSHAGLSAAMAIGRLRRSALIVDAGSPRNAVAEHANNIAGMDGVDPNILRANSKKDLKKYKSIDFVEDKVLKVTQKSDLYEAKLESGESVTVRKVILTYGIKDRFPSIKGIEKLWGHSVFHCPYCHGYEVKDQKIGLISNGAIAEHILPLLKNISDDLILFTQGQSEVSSETTMRLKKSNIPIIESPITEINHDEKKIESVRLENNETVKVQALLLGPSLPLSLNSDIGKSLGCETNEMGLIKVSETGETSVEGVFAAGDIITTQQTVVNAMSTGQSAGSSIVYELSKEDFERK